MATTANPETTSAQRMDEAVPGGAPTDRKDVPPVKARQGFRGKPVLYVLVASILLLILAYVLIGGFAGEIVQAPPAG
jgi:hypothetical protein